MKIALSLIVGVAVGWLANSYVNDQYEFKQLKRGDVEVMYRVHKRSGDVKYVAAATDSQRAPDSEWVDVGSVEEVFGSKK